jgi:hypothetical protein
MSKITVIAVVAGSFAVLASAEMAGASASGRVASTRLTIGEWPKGVFGYVQSPNTARCARGRSVRVFIQRPGGRFKRLASVSVGRNQVGYEWTADAPRGRLYASAPAKAGCAAARSRTISLGFKGLPQCPSDGPKCILVIEFIAYNLYPCLSFSADENTCSGAMDRGNPGWYVPEQNPPGYPQQNEVHFSWDKGVPRVVRFDAHDALIAAPATESGTILGTVSCSHCADYKVSDACSFARGSGYGGNYYTPNSPGVAPGADGGPLYLNFDGGTDYVVYAAPTHVIIWGTLYRKPVVRGVCSRP